MKLGELLISAGKLTQEQVEETLKGQAIFGGRFGTNLVEMGYLDENELALFLSRKTGIPHASPEQLMDIPSHVLRLIPEEMVRKHRVVPVAVNNRKLIVAMADPSDFAAIDEISFITGYIVLPVITPELRLVNALEKHYKIRREMRYIKVEGGGRNRARVSAAPAPEAPKPVVPSRPAPPPIEIDFDDDILELPLLSELESFGDLEEAHAHVSVPVAAPAPVPEPVVAVAAPRPEPEKDYSLEAVLKGFTRAEDRDGVADLVVSYAAQRFNRSALFLVKGGKAQGWAAQCGKKPVPNFGKLEIELSEPSILRVVAESKGNYVGPLPATPANSALVSALGGGTPANNLLVPLMMVGRVVAILYVEGGTLRPDEEVADLQRLLGKASLAFEILILKSKILLT